MLKDFPEVQRWIKQGREAGREEGEKLGEARGELQATRGTLERQLTVRFGPLSAATTNFLALRTRDELDELAVQLLAAPDLAALGLPE